MSDYHFELIRGYFSEAKYYSTNLHFGLTSYSEGPRVFS